MKKLVLPLLLAVSACSAPEPQDTPQTTAEASSASAASTGSAPERPRLVLQITVDQLRGDMLARYGAHFGEGGFSYLLDNGAVFVDAHHRHANTETVVGHATLATGTDPAVHGMVANLWYDRVENSPFYNVQDVDYPLLGAAGVDESAEIDPTQRAATTDGRSPRAIASSTISDEIALHFGPEAGIYGVSVKDRGAITMAGHAGEAYWFSKAEGRFVTSTFYRDAYPGWVEDWHAEGHVSAYAGEAWTLADPVETYQFGDRDDQPWETALPGFGRTFPHEWGDANGRFYTTLLTISPAGDELVADFAMTLMDEEALGQDDIPDFLSVSFSATDYVGHMFGPSSLEAEANLRALDRTLARLLAHVDATVGLDRTLIILSADHGVAEHPSYLSRMGIEVTTFSFDRIDTEPGRVRLDEAFGDSGDLISSFSNPYVYLDREVIAERGLDAELVERTIAAELQALPGIAFAVPSTALRRGEIAGGGVLDSVLANFHPDRSGDIYIVFEPHVFIADFDGLTVAATHGSPWSYDSFVPVIFAGPGIPAQRIHRRIETVDVAPTIAAYLGTKPPSGARGEPLIEVFGQEPH